MYMGIMNMMIVIPMLIETLTFGPIYQHLLGDNPSAALTFAGILLFAAALATLCMQTRAGISNMPMMRGGGH